MAKQIIIAISREYGSGGHDIAEKIAQELNLKMYDRSLLREIAEHMDMSVDTLRKYDEKPRNFILTRTVGKHTNSMEDILAKLQFDFIKNKAREGESFVIVGRCAETLLKERDGLISIFITGNRDYKRKRIMKDLKLNEKDAEAEMNRIDRKRRQYHNRYSEHKWGDSRYYDMCINGSDLGVDGTVEILKQYIQARLEAEA